MAFNADNYKNVTKTCSCSCNCISKETRDFEFQRSVKRKLEGASNGHVLYDLSEKENEILALRDELRSQHEALEEERKASASAADEVLMMINRLQKEKAEVELSAKHFKFFAEQEIAIYEKKLIDMRSQLDKKDNEIRRRECMLKKDHNDLRSVDSICSAKFDPSEETTECLEITISAIEEYLSNENLSPWECIERLDDRMKEMEETGCNNHLNNEWVATRKVLQKILTVYSVHVREAATPSSDESVSSSNFYVENERMPNVSDISASTLPANDDVIRRKLGGSNQSVVDISMEPTAESASPVEGKIHQQINQKISTAKRDRSSMAQAIESLKSEEAHDLILSKEIGDQKRLRETPNEIQKVPRQSPKKIRKEPRRKDDSIFSVIQRCQSYLFQKPMEVEQKGETDGLSSKNVGLLSLFDKEPTGRISACKNVGIPPEATRAQPNPDLKLEKRDAL